jgi:exonuclease SbcC
LIGSEISNLKKYKQDKEEYEKKSRMWKVYDALISAYGKNGLPQLVLSQQLPMINKEIASILQGVCGFTVVLEQDGNNLEITIDYGDSQRPIELGSGMEKMMASLAIRVALINVSSLPKTDMLIIDEGFGALDEVNVEACNRLLVSLKRFFKTIIVISHVDAVKDAVDNIIEISKTGPDSFVWA